MNEQYILQAEESIIGAVLIDAKKVLPLIADRLEARHFYMLSLSKIYQVMLNMAFDGAEIDFITLLARLLQAGFSEDEAKVILVHCMEICPTTANAVRHSEIIIDCYKARRASEIANDVVIKNIGHENADDIIRQAGDELSQLLITNRGAGLRAMADIIGQHYGALFDKEQLKYRLDFGLNCLDKILGGVYGGNLLVIGARPAVGKTAFVMQFAKSLAMNGKSVAFYSLEMGEKELLQRYVSNISGIAMQKIKDMDYTDNEPSEIAQTCDKLWELPLRINDKPYISISDIKNECRFEKGLDAIIIDYLQLLQPRAGGRNANRTEAVGQISRDLKIMAKELKVPVVVLSQLNRVTDEESEPHLSDLRESGSIEQDADVVMMMWKSDPEENIVGCKVCKNRNGRTGKVALAFDGARMRFVQSTHRLEPSRGKAYEWESAGE